MAENRVSIIGQLIPDFSKFNAKLRSLGKDNTVRVGVANSSRAIQQIQRIEKSTKDATTAAEKFGNALALKTEQFAVYTIAAAAIGRVAFEIAQATREAIRFEQQMVRLSQVFDNNVGANDDLKNTIRRLSIEYGQAANQLARTSVILAQTGLSAKETSAAIEALTKTTLAATFSNIERTTEGAVAIMNQFRIEASELADVMDIVNSVSKRFAVESNDIIEAVKRAGGAFSASGGSFEEFVALFTSIRSTTRETAETIGTGLRTIFARIQRPKVIDYFKELNIELENADGTFVGPLVAVQRLSEGLDRLGIVAGQTKFIEVVEQLGGLRQVARVIPLLRETAKTQEALAISQNASGSVARDAAKAQETLAVRFEQTKQRFEDLVFRITETKSFQDLASGLLKLANTVLSVAESLKELLPLLITLQAINVGRFFGAGLKNILTRSSTKTLSDPAFQLRASRGGRMGYASGGQVITAHGTEYVLHKNRRPELIHGPQSGYTEVVDRNSFIVPIDTPATRSNRGLTKMRLDQAKGLGYKTSGVPSLARGGFADGTDPFEEFFKRHGLDEESSRKFDEKTAQYQKDLVESNKKLREETAALRKTLERRIKISKTSRGASADPLGGPEQQARARAQRAEEHQRESLALSEAGRFSSAESTADTIDKNLTSNAAVIARRAQTHDRTLEVENQVKARQDARDAARRRLEESRVINASRKNDPYRGTPGLIRLRHERSRDVRNASEELEAREENRRRASLVNTRYLGPANQNVSDFLSGKPPEPYGPFPTYGPPAPNKRNKIFDSVISSAEAASVGLGNLTNKLTAASIASVALQSFIDPATDAGKVMQSLSNIVVKMTVVFGVLQFISNLLASAKAKELAVTIASISGKGIFSALKTGLATLLTPVNLLIGAIAIVAGAAFVAGERLKYLADTAQAESDRAVESGNAEEARRKAEQAQVYRTRSPLKAGAAVGGAGAAIGAFLGPIGAILGFAVGGLAGIFLEYTGVFGYLFNEFDDPIVKLKGEIAATAAEVNKINTRLASYGKVQGLLLDDIRDLQKQGVGSEEIFKSVSTAIDRLQVETPTTAADFAKAVRDQKQRAFELKRADEEGSDISEEQKKELSKLKNEQDQLIKAMSEEADVRLKSVTEILSTARASGLAGDAIRKMNEGVELEIDSRGQIIKESVRANGFLNKVLEGLRISYKDEDLAIKEFSRSMRDGTGYLKAFNEATAKAYQNLDADLITSLFGTAEEKIARIRGRKQAQVIARGVEGGDISGFGPGQKIGEEYLRGFFGTNLRIFGDKNQTAEQVFYGVKGQEESGLLGQKLARDLQIAGKQVDPKEIRAAVVRMRDAANIDQAMLTVNDNQLTELKGIKKALENPQDAKDEAKQKAKVEVEAAKKDDFARKAVEEKRAKAEIEAAKKVADEKARGDAQAVQENGGKGEDVPEKTNKSLGAEAKVAARARQVSEIQNLFGRGTVRESNVRSGLLELAKRGKLTRENAAEVVADNSGLSPGGTLVLDSSGRAGVAQTGFTNRMFTQVDTLFNKLDTTPPPDLAAIRKDFGLRSQRDERSELKDLRQRLGNIDTGNVSGRQISLMSEEQFTYFIDSLSVKIRDLDKVADKLGENVPKKIDIDLRNNGAALENGRGALQAITNGVTAPPAPGIAQESSGG